MSDRVAGCRTSAWITLVAHAIVVASTMVCDMDCSEILCVPRVKLLHHVFELYLMHNYIEVVDFCQDAHLKLATPGTILGHQLNVPVNMHIVFDIKLVVLLVGLQDLYHGLSELDMLELFAVELVSHRTEETVAVIACLLDSEAFLAESDSEPGEVDSVLADDSVGAVHLIAAIDVAIFITLLLFLCSPSIFCVDGLRLGQDSFLARHCRFVVAHSGTIFSRRCSCRCLGGASSLN